MVYTIFLNPKLQHSHFLIFFSSVPKFTKTFGNQIAHTKTRQLTFPVSDFNNFIWIPPQHKTNKAMSCCGSKSLLTDNSSIWWVLLSSEALFVRWFAGVVCGKQTSHTACLENVGWWKWPLSLWFGDLTVNSERPATSQTASPTASSLHYPAIAWGPIAPAALFASLFPFLLLFPSLSPLLSPFLFFTFSLSPGCLSPVLLRAPCVTRLIKTNTDPILVSNPIVLFFFSPALEHAEYWVSWEPQAPPVTDLRFQTLGNITYGGQRVNKVLLNSTLAHMCKQD